jgi:ferritin-like metal-binding protein YciE
MFEKLNTPEDIFNFKLGAALTMEQTVLDMLGQLQEKANRPELKQLLSHHADETRQHIDNIKRSFEVLGVDVDDSPCPAIEGIEKEGQANLKKADDELADIIILSGATETEHHEIAVYESLITSAKARGANEVAQLLQQNLEQEQHTLEEVKAEAQKVATEGTRVNA